MGMDGASWDALHLLMASDRLPALAGMVSEGCRARLDNHGQGYSPAIWTSMATGVPPEEHGIDFFTTWAWRNPFSGRLRYAHWARAFRFRGSHQLLRALGFRRVAVSSAQRRRPALWNLLTAQGRSVGVANWWATYPAEAVRGALVSDHANSYVQRLRRDLRTVDLQPHQSDLLPSLTCPESLFSHLWQPARMGDRELLELVSRFAHLSEDQQDRLRRVEVFARGDELSVLKFSLLQDLFTIRATRTIITEYGQPDLIALVLGGLDAMSHYFWRFLFPEHFSPIDPAEMAVWGDALPEYYAFYDEALAELRALFSDPTIVIVVSDHGIVPVLPEGSLGPNSGTHDDGPDGVWLAAGPGIAGGRDAGRISMVDVAPTVLHMLGLPVPRDLSGRVATELFEKPGQVRYEDSDLDGTPPSDPGGPLDEGTEDEVASRLRALGYID